MSSTKIAYHNFNLLLLILGALAAFGPLSIDMYLPAFPSLAKELGVDIGKIQLSLTAFLAGLSIGQLIYGPLTDRFGRKKPLIFGISLFLASSIFCSVATSAEMLIIGRFFQALGSCVGMVISRAIVRDLFRAQEAARVFSLIMLVMGLAPILAPVLGGQLLTFVGWRGIFWFLIAFGALVLVSVSLYLPETKGPNRNIKLGEAFVSYFYFFRQKGFMGYVLIGSFSSAGMFAYITGSPFVFIELFKIPAEYYGVIFGTNAIGLIAASQINARLLKTVPVSTLLKNALTVAAVAGVTLCLSAVLNGGFWITVISLFFFVSTIGFISPNSTAQAMDSQGERAGVASAFLGAFQFSVAACSSGLVSYFANGTVGPMSYMLGFCSLMAFLAYFLFNSVQVKSDEPAISVGR